MALISLSRRTDIPAFYGDWLIRRLRAGYCLVKHPFRADWIRRVDLGPEAVDGLVFWTRYPEPFLGHPDEIERLGLPYYFQMTLNAMDRLLEPRLPPPEALLSSFESLSLRVGPERLIWRFDPILVSSVTPPEEIAGRFEGLCARLAGRCRRVVVSLAQLYAKTTRRLSKIQDLTVTDLNADESAGLAEDLLGRLAETARGHGLEVRICAGLVPPVVDEALKKKYGSA